MNAPDGRSTLPKITPVENTEKKDITDNHIAVINQMTAIIDDADTYTVADLRVAVTNIARAVRRHQRRLNQLGRDS